MKFNKDQLKDYITTEQEKLGPHVRIRIRFLLEELVSKRHHKYDCDNEDIDLFELLVKLIYIADAGVADSIANLMIPLTNEGHYLMDNNTISESASFLRDYLKKDSTLNILRDRSMSGNI